MTTDSPIVIEIDTTGDCTIRDRDGEAVAEGVTAAELQALAGAANLMIPAMEVPDEIRVSFCSCGEQWIEPSDDGNQHVSHTYVTKRYVVAPWIAGRDGGSQ